MKRAIAIGTKIYFRPLERADIDGGWLDWVNDMEGSQFRSGATVVTRGQLEDYFENQQQNAIMFAVCRKSDQQYVGNVRLSNINYNSRTAGYGRLLGRDYRRQGLGSDALLQLFRYGFHQLGMNLLWTEVMQGHVGSIRSNERVGSVREGIKRQAVFKQGAFSDLVRFSMLRAEFDNLHGEPEQWVDYERDEIKKSGGVAPG